MQRRYVLGLLYACLPELRPVDQCVLHILETLMIDFR